MNRLPKLAGYAAVWSAIGRAPGGYCERFACGAFGKATDFNQTEAWWQHDFKLPLAFGHIKSGPGRLTLREDGFGLAFEIEPFEDGRWIDSAVADIRVGKVRGMSPCFVKRTVDGYPEKLASGLVVFTVTRAELVEISPVHNPAYQETSLRLIEPAANAESAEPAASSPASRREIIRIDPALVSNPRRRNIRAGMTINC
jgi:HK97 family phage prohead protease